MTMHLILALAALAQPADAAMARRDLEFAAAVEDFAGCPPPGPFPALFRRMGSREWRVREAASAECLALVRSDPGLARWLFAGRRDRDPEIRLRCNAALRRLAPCGQCRGTGVSSHWSEYPCGGCDGLGSGWPYSPWD